jgi:aminomuconate-semialdehyde/2-hydroxymuconate-6-semialdehyde dehydrogenase
MIQVIQAIQKAKAAQARDTRLSREDRALKLRRLAELLSREQEKILDWEPQIEREFLREHSFEAAVLRLKEAAAQLDLVESTSTSYLPTGLITIVLPSVFSLRVLCERLAPALAAGNAVLVKLSSQSLNWGPAFEQLLFEAGFTEGICQLLHGTAEEIGSLMINHPAVRAVSFAGRFVTAENILKTGTLYQKKLQFSKSGNNSAVLVGDSWSDEQLRPLVHSCFRAGGRLPWNTTKIFVSEEASGKFIEDFLRLIRNEGAYFKGELNENYYQQLSLIRSEGGKVLLEAGPDLRATVVLDLPHCSAIQQNEVLSPIVLISPVKYLHEAVKWANVGYLGMSAMVLGDQEKALRTAEKLECGQVWINSWIQSRDGVIVGAKQSVFGDMDFRVFGSFYSECKKIGTPTSKL